MGKKNPAHGHDGLGARGQGKMLYYHTQVAQAVQQSKAQAAQIPSRPPEKRQSDGRWTEPK